MAKDQLYDLIDRTISGEASEEELQELGELLGMLMPEEPVRKEEIEQAYTQMVRRMKERGIPFGN
jgi:hypothetical protein